MQQLIEEKDTPEVTLSHPKAKEWIVSMAKANYQELAKLASEFPELVKLQVSLRSREIQLIIVYINLFYNISDTSILKFPKVIFKYVYKLII